MGKNFREAGVGSGLGGINPGLFLMRGEEEEGGV